MITVRDWVESTGGKDKKLRGGETGEKVCGVVREEKKGVGGEKGGEKSMGGW